MREGLGVLKGVFSRGITGEEGGAKDKKSILGC